MTAKMLTGSSALYPAKLSVSVEGESCCPNNCGKALPLFSSVQAGNVPGLTDPSGLESPLPRPGPTLLATLTRSEERGRPAPKDSEVHGQESGQQMLGKQMSTRWLRPGGRGAGCGLGPGINSCGVFDTGGGTAARDSQGSKSVQWSLTGAVLCAQGAGGPVCPLGHPSF